MAEPRARFEKQKNVTNKSDLISRDSLAQMTTNLTKVISGLERQLLEHKDRSRELARAHEDEIEKMTDIIRAVGVYIFSQLDFSKLAKTINKDYSNHKSYLSVAYNLALVILQDIAMHSELELTLSAMKRWLSILLRSHQRDDFFTAEIIIGAFARIPAGLTDLLPEKSKKKLTDMSFLYMKSENLFQSAMQSKSKNAAVFNLSNWAARIARLSETESSEIDEVIENEIIQFEKLKKKYHENNYQANIQNINEIVAVLELQNDMLLLEIERSRLRDKADAESRVSRSKGMQDYRMQLREIDNQLQQTISEKLISELRFKLTNDFVRQVKQKLRIKDMLAEVNKIKDNVLPVLENNLLEYSEEVAKKIFESSKEQKLNACNDVRRVLKDKKMSYRDKYDALSDLLHSKKDHLVISKRLAGMIREIQGHLNSLNRKTTDLRIARKMYIESQLHAAKKIKLDLKQLRRRKTLENITEHASSISTLRAPRKTSGDDVQQSPKKAITPRQRVQQRQQSRQNMPLRKNAIVPNIDLSIFAGLDMQKQLDDHQPLSSSSDLNVSPQALVEKPLDVASSSSVVSTQQLAKTVVTPRILELQATLFTAPASSPRSVDSRSSSASSGTKVRGMIEKFNLNSQAAQSTTIYPKRNASFNNRGQVSMPAFDADVRARSNSASTTSYKKK